MAAPMSENSALTPAPASRERIAALVALVTVVASPSLFSFHFMSFSDVKLAAYAAAACALLFLVPRRAVMEVLGRRWVLALAAMLLWGEAVSFCREMLGLGGMSPVFAGGLGVAGIAALAICGALDRRTLLVAVALSAVPVAALAMLQYAGALPGMFPRFNDYDQRMYSVFGNQDLLGGYLAIGMSLAVALWLAREISRAAVTALILSILPPLVLSGSRSAWLAAAVGFGVALAAARRRSYRRVAPLLGVCAGLAVGVVWLDRTATWDRLTNTFSGSDVGFRIRLWIWDGTLRLIGEHPVAGVGLGNYAYYSPRALGEALHARGPGFHLFNHLHTLHAHSDPLELFAETGAIGLLLLVLALAFLPRRSSPAWAGLAAYVAFSLVNTTLHSPPHVLAFLLMAGALGRREGDLSFRPERYGGEKPYLPAMAAVLVVFHAFTALYPSYLWARAQALYQAGSDNAKDAYARAAYRPGSVGAAAELATILANEGEEDRATIMAGLASLVLDTGELYYLRAHLAERPGNAPEAARLYRECLLRWPDHQPAYEGLLRTAPPEDRDAITAESLRWLGPDEGARLRMIVEATQTPPTPPSPATRP